MNKIFGNKELFMPVRQDESRTIISYDYKEEADGVNATWYEVYFYKKRNGVPSFEQVREAVLEDINARTDEKILSGCEWTVLHGNDAGTVAKVWLSKENQTNYKAMHDVAKDYSEDTEYPVKIKINEDDDKNPIYDYFQNFAELSAFYLSGVAYIKQCLTEGWQKKDSMDWTPYEQRLNPSEQ